MKNLMYLFVVSLMFAFTACGGGENATEATEVETAVEAVACADDCQKACCLGCKATEGDATCMVLADGSMPCCVVKTEAVACCCGDATCDGSCHGDADAAAEAHGDHDH